MYTNMFSFYSYTVTVNAYLGNTYNEIFKYCYTKHYYIVMFLFVMRTVLLFYKPLLLFLILLLFLVSMVYTCRSLICKSEMFV